MKKLIFYNARSTSFNLSTYTTSNNQFYFLQPFYIVVDPGGNVNIELLFEPNSAGEKMQNYHSLLPIFLIITAQWQ